jgi:hypothetical protein
MATLVETRTPPKARILKQVNPLNIGSEAFEPGDFCFKLSNFDDYVYFQLTEIINGVESLMDLTVYGDLFLKFVSSKNSVYVSSVENLQNIEAARGEVVFRISKAVAEGLVDFSSDNFIIVSKIVKDTDSSFETILFEGKFLKPQASQKISARFNSLYSQSVANNLITLKQNYENAFLSYAEKEDRIKSLKNQLDQEKITQQTLSKQFESLNQLLISKKPTSGDIDLSVGTNTQSNNQTSLTSTGLENLGNSQNLPTPRPPRGGSEGTAGGGRPAPTLNNDGVIIARIQ